MKLLVEFLLAAVAVYAVLALGACALQDRLIFYPQPPGPTLPRAPAGWRVEPLPLAAADGTPLEGWIVRREARAAVTDAAPRAAGTDAPRAAVVYFGGNAEEVSWMAEMAPHFGPVALVLVNYRGYGRSGGVAAERSLFADASTVYDAVTARPDVDPAAVIAHGRSLGSAVAVNLAAERPLCGVILTSPFDSVAALARPVFGWLPLDLLLRHRFDSLARAPRLRSPLLVLAGDRDAVVPIAHSRALFEAWAGPKQFVTIAGADHVDVAASPAYWSAIGRFVARCAAAPTTADGPANPDTPTSNPAAAADHAPVAGAPRAP